MATQSTFQREYGIAPKDLADYAAPSTPTLADFAIMRRDDATINGALRSIERPILAATYDIVPPSDKPTPQEKEIAKTLKENILYHKHWKKTLFAFMDDTFTFGSGILEIVLDRIDGLRLLGEKGLRYRPRPSMEEPSDGKDRHGYLKKLVQVTDRGRITIPREKLIICTNEAKGPEDWVGTSLLRSAYKPWYRKLVLQNVSSAAAERWGFGIPYITLPDPSLNRDGNVAQRNNKKMIEYLKALQSGTNSIMIIPFSAKFEVLQAPGQVRILEEIKDLKKDIFSAMLINQIELPENDAGPATKLYLDEGLKSVDSWAKDITSSFNDDLIKIMVDLNWPGQKRYPRMIVKNILNNFILNVLGFLAQSGLISPSEDLVRFIYDSYDIDADPKKAVPEIMNPNNPKINGEKQNENENQPEN